MSFHVVLSDTVCVKTGRKTTTTETTTTTTTTILHDTTVKKNNIALNDFCPGRSRRRSRKRREKNIRTYVGKKKEKE